MLKEKRINYAIGLIFCILLFGFMAAPYFGDATCYELLEAFSITQVIGENSLLVTANNAFLIISIIAVALLSILAIIGFVLKCTKYSQSKAENIISIIYSLMLFFIIASMFVVLILSLVWLINAELKVKYGFIVLFAIIYLFPYFCATKFNFIFTVYMTVCITYLGFVFFILHEKVFKPAYYKKPSCDEDLKKSL